jgi:hypothetical protein
MSIRTRGGLVAACLCLASAPLFAIPESSHTGSCGPSIQGGGGESAATSTFVPEASASAPASTPAPAASTEVAMAPSASSSAPEAAPAPAEPAPTSAPSAPAEHAAAPAPKPAKTKGWWPSRSDGKLNIVDVRSGEFSKSIVIQTDGQFQSADAAASAIQVSAANGQSVEQKWSVGANKKTLILPVPAGKYTVKIGTQLADASGKAVAKDSSGTVEVH